MSATTTARRLRGLAMLACFGLGCAALGARWGRPPAPAAARRSADDRADLVRQIAADVRRAVATTVAAAAVQSGAAPAPATAVPGGTTASGPVGSPAADASAASAPSLPSPALEAARAVVQDAIARGSWRADDADAMRASLAALNSREAVDILGQLARAINTGRVQVATGHGPVL